MDHWGFVGPSFGPLRYFVQTYFCTLRLHGWNDEELWLERYDDMIVWDGAYYGDMSIFIAERHQQG